MTDPGWFRQYFTEPYGEVYEEYLLPPQVAAEEAQFVLDKLNLQPGERILDCPCGYARHMDQIGHLFPDMVGVDLDADCLERARGFLPLSRGPFLLRGDMRVLPFRDASFDAVLHLFNSFGYFDDAGNRQLLCEFGRVLRGGGRLLVDIGNPGPLIDIVRREPRTCQRHLDLTFTEDWRYDDDTHTLHNETCIQVAGRETRRGYAVRLYSLEEMHAMCADAGMEISEVYGSMEDEEYSPAKSARMIMKIRRRWLD